MDLNDVRSLVTLASFVMFLGLMAWTWWPARRDAHDDAAQLPFIGEVQDIDHAGAQRGIVGTGREQ